MVHTLRLDNYSPTPRKLVLGTNSSFGTESIKIERGAGWYGLNLTATWHIPGREEPLRVALLDGDAMDVPPEVTKEAKDGVLVLAGLASGVQRASCNVEYLILEQAGVYGGADAEPTPELAAQVLEAALQAKADAKAAAEDAAAAKANADKAQADAKKAQQAAENAAADAAKAGPYAEAARAAQEAAESARDEAIAAQQAAENAAAAAAASKSAADTLAAEAARAAQAAENSKTAANKAAYFAGENATAAQQAADTATAAANDAGQSASDAAASKAAAETAAKAAQDAQTAAAAAKAEAVKAQEAAQTAAKSAQDAQAAAEKVRDDAKTAQKGAEAARDVAAKSAEAAAKSEANVKQSADTLAESVKNITPDDSSIGDKPWSSKHIIDMLCPPLEESGNPVVCYPVAGYPLGIKAKWEPAQEGTGTPYPAGGGPNKLNVAGVVSSRTISGITFTINPDGTIGVNGTSTATCFLNPNTKFNKAYLQKIPAGAYRFDFEQTALSIFLFGYYEDGSESPIVYAGNVVTYAQDAYVGPQIRVAAGVTVNTTARLMLHTGTSTPSAYAGWENIRPIKGRDSVKVERCGENLLPHIFDKIPDMVTKDGLTIVKTPKGTIHVSGKKTGTNWTDLFRIKLAESELVEIPAGTYSWGSGVSLVTNHGNIHTSPSTIDTPLIITGAYAAVNTAGTYNKDYIPALVAGSEEPTKVEPYQGSTNTLTLPETVYGGEVDAVTGEGQDTQKLVILNGTELWNSWGINAYNPAITGFYTYDINDYDAKNTKVICNHLETPNKDVWGGRNAGIGFATVGSSRYFMLSMLTSSLPDISAGHEVASLKAYLAAQNDAGTPVQIAYKLATPTPFTATGAQPIPALAGVNTVLTDADSATVTGRADPIKRIEDLEAAVASIN